jgi:hypothetical protein
MRPSPQPSRVGLAELGPGAVDSDLKIRMKAGFFEAV